MIEQIKNILSDLLRFILTFTDYEYENIQWERIHRKNYRSGSCTQAISAKRRR